MKALKIFRNFLAMSLMVGFPCPILSAELFDMGHSVIFAPICFVSAFIGTSLIFGLSGFRDRPKYIGNVDGNYTKPYINQNWAVFFISLVINLTLANLCG